MTELVPIYRQTFDEPLAFIGVAHITCPECGGTTRFELPDGEKIRCNECKGSGRICVNLF